MFTGLIQALGTIATVDRERFQIAIQPPNASIVLQDLAIGDSVAVDGICLTVEEISGDGFIATASPETLQKTTLGKRDRATNRVNLETSLRLGSKIGGHFVTGHVDGLGCLLESIVTATSWELRFGIPQGMQELESQWQETIARFIVSKGSIAVNGISLTVADCDPRGNWFVAAVIPHTYASTNLNDLHEGELVNIEGDVLGKYVDRLLSHRFPSTNHMAKAHSKDIDLAFLAENGYL
jgi:riboflavin synthase